VVDTHKTSYYFKLTNFMVDISFSKIIIEILNKSVKRPIFIKAWIKINNSSGYFTEKGGIFYYACGRQIFAESNYLRGNELA